MAHAFVSTWVYVSRVLGCTRRAGPAVKTWDVDVDGIDELGVSQPATVRALGTERVPGGEEQLNVRLSRVRDGTETCRAGCFSPRGRLGTDSGGWL
jgi:hypothetical protein